MSSELLRPPVFQYKEKFNAEVVQDGSDFLPRATFSLSQATRSAFSTNRTILLVLFHLSRCLLEEEANKKHAKIMTPSTNQCLLWACLTSKAFCNAGLDILWANQSSVYPALKILPCVSLSDSGFYILRGPVSREDWIRFDFYSRRVRKLVLDQPQDVTAQDVYVQLARIHPAPLLPALTVLTIASIDDDIVDNLTLAFHCISPSLSSVQLGITKGLKGEMFVVSFLSALSREAISLRELTFQINGPFTSEAIGDLAYLKSLETLTLSITAPVSYANLAKLSEIAALSTLVFKFREEATLTDKPGPFSTHGATWALKRLQMSGKSTVIKEVLISLNSLFSKIETFETLFLDIPPTPNPIPWSWAPSTVLKDLTIRVMQCSPAMESLEIHLKSFSPLPLHSLRSLKLSGTKLKASDLDILKICQKGRWTNLEILHLPCTALSLGSPSIATLSILAQWCPKLRILCVAVDLGLRDVGYMQDKIDQNVESHPLTYLEISTGSHPDKKEFNEAVVISQYIDCFFPHLQVLRPYEGKDEDYWEGIWSMIKAYRRFRNGQPVVGNTKGIDFVSATKLSR